MIGNSILYNVAKAFLSKFSSVQIYKFPCFVLYKSPHYKVKGPQMRKILNTIKPGDILLRRYDHYISGLMIPGYYTHTALVVDLEHVIHMLGKGVTHEDILTFMRCDHITILRFDENIKKAQKAIDIAIEAAKKYYSIGIDYDYLFNFDNNDKMSCTEFIKLCYGDTVTFNTKILNNYIVPDDFLNANQLKEIYL